MMLSIILLLVVLFPLSSEYAMSLKVPRTSLVRPSPGGLLVNRIGRWSPSGAACS